MYKMKCGKRLVFLHWLHWLNNNLFSAQRATIGFASCASKTVAANAIGIEI